jgi:membrane associated rhomboid family serine protease|tara:strand:- start:105 stop:1076 length:972 start_codon:yes stop_codon:yes gene_type:complete
MWPSRTRTKKAQTTVEDDGEDGDEFLPNESSPFLRGLSNARYAICGPKAACKCTSATFVVLIIDVVAFILVYFFTVPAHASATAAASMGALLGPSQCQLAGGGGLWPADLRFRFNVSRLFSSTFLHASIFHLLVSLCTLMRYGLSFEHRRSLGELVLLVMSAGILGGLVSATTCPNVVLVCGSAPAFALIGDEIVNVLYMGGCTLFDGTGSRSKRRLPYRLMVVGAFAAANITVLLIVSGAVSFWACLACATLGGLATMSEYPSRKSTRAQLDHGEGTGDEWAWWKRSGYLVGVVSVCVLFAVAILGFEGATSISDHPAPVCV